MLAYIAQPSGRPPTPFRLLRIGEHEAVFENPEHDFPQRITYSRPEASRLLVGIEGPGKGERRKIEFAFSRTDCDAPLAAGPAK